MVEFGAGGNITQGVAEPAVPAVGGETGAAATPGAPATPPANQRRKRKAKGWFCPICRQRTLPFCVIFALRSDYYFLR
jgi:hypothetical protein